MSRATPLYPGESKPLRCRSPRNRPRSPQHRTWPEPGVYHRIAPASRMAAPRDPAGAPPRRPSRAPRRPACRSNHRHGAIPGWPHSTRNSPRGPPTLKTLRNHAVSVCLNRPLSSLLSSGRWIEGLPERSPWDALPLYTRSKIPTSSSEGRKLGMLSHTVPELALPS